MIHKNPLHLLLLLAAFSLTSCSGIPKTGGGGGGNGTATVSFTLVADTLPANPSLLSFKVTILSITLTPTSGTAQTFTPASPIVVDLMRLQSDTAFLGSLANVPAGTYTVQVSLSASNITFLNDTASNITVGTTVCPSNAFCSVALTAVGTPTISSTTFSFTASSGGQQGIELDFKLNNAITLTNGTLAVNFSPNAPNPGVFTAFNLPRTTPNLGANQLELIEDFTGVVSLSGSSVTIKSQTRGNLTVTESSSSFFDASPDGTICPSPATFKCVVNGQIASVDAFLNSNGTLALKEFEPLTSTQEDLVEGVVLIVPSLTQFVMAVTDENQAATGSLIGNLNTGELLTVNLATVPTLQPFLVDTKGLAVASIAPGTLGNFALQTDTSAIHPGQTIAVHVTSFTAPTNTTIASAVVNTVTLRWSRFSSAVQTASQVFTISGIPSYFNFVPGSLFEVQTFIGTAGADGVTNFDGVTDGNGLTPTTPPVGVRALFLENTSFSANPAFFAAKVRQH